MSIHSISSTRSPVSGIDSPITNSEESFRPISPSTTATVSSDGSQPSEIILVEPRRGSISMPDYMFVLTKKVIRQKLAKQKLKDTRLPTIFEDFKKFLVVPAKARILKESKLNRYMN